MENKKYLIMGKGINNEDDKMKNIELYLELNFETTEEIAKKHFIEVRDTKLYNKYFSLYEIIDETQFIKKEIKVK